MRIGFDIDGVLANFESAYAPLLEKYSGLKISREMPTVWNWPYELYGISPDIEEKAWNDILSDPEFWNTLEPTKECAESLELLNSLRNDGHYVCFITTRPGDYSHEATVKWLARQGFANAIVFIAANSQEKANIAEREKLDFFIDDKPANIGAVEDVVPYTALLDRPWNTEAVLELSVHAKHPVDAVKWAMEGMNLWGV